MEKTIQTKTCKKCSAKYEITNKDLEFYDKISPKFNGEKFSIPTPILCPDCRAQRRSTWRNERNLYRRKCSATWESIISVYSEDKNYKIYLQDFWWSDKWNALDYWIDFDFNKTFFEEFNNLQSIVPRLSIINDNWLNSINCEYCYNFSYWKNKYLVTTAWHAEYSMYCQYG